MRNRVSVLKKKLQAVLSQNQAGMAPRTMAYVCECKYRTTESTTTILECKFLRLFNEIFT